MKDVLEETYGVMVYQEQVMRILNRLGGIELSQAYAVHQGDLQEEDRGHRARSQAVPRRGGRARAGEGSQGDQDLRPDRILRRLRLQQVALDGVCPGRLPDGLPQDALPDEFMAALLSSEMDGCGAREVLRRAYRRLPDGWAWKSCQPERQRRPRTPSGSRNRRQDPLRPLGDQGGRRRRRSRRS